jgi:hypothetical protein
MGAVSMHAAGHSSLSDMTLRLQPGAHAAMSGRLEAGQSCREDLREAAQGRLHRRSLWTRSSCDKLSMSQIETCKITIAPLSIL